MNANDLIQKGVGVATTVAGQAQRLSKQAADTATGLASKTLNRGPKELDDVTITRKVESIIFRENTQAKSSIDVNTVDGVVYLRGTLKTAAQINAIEQAVRAIPEVKDVENLITQPKTRKKQPTGRFKKAGEKPVRRGKFTDDRTSDIVDEAEAPPKTKAAKREGRTPAPMGSKGEGRKPSGSGDDSGETGSGTTGRGTPSVTGTADKAGSIPTPTV